MKRQHKLSLMYRLEDSPTNVSGDRRDVVEFNVPEELSGGTCELQVQLRPSHDRDKQLIRLSQIVSRTR